MERKWWTLIAVSVAIFMLLLDITVVNVALPDIQRSLHSSFSDLQWVVNAYALTLAAFLLDLRLGRGPDRTQARLHRGPVRVHDLLRCLRPVDHAADAEPRARRAGHRRGDDVRDRARADRPGVPRQGARDGVRRVRCGHRRERWRSGRCSAGSSPRASAGSGSSSSTSRSASIAVFIALTRSDGLARPERHRRRLGGPRDVLRLAVPARVRARAGQRKGLGLDRDRLIPDRRGRADGAVHASSSSARAARCSNCRCSAAPPSAARASSRSPCRARSSRCSSTSPSTSRTCSATARCRPGCGSFRRRCFRSSSPRSRGS